MTWCKSFRDPCSAGRLLLLVCGACAIGRAPIVTAAGSDDGIRLDFTTHRAGFAYLPDRLGQRVFAADEALTRPAVACGISDGASASGPNGQPFRVLCRNSRYLFANDLITGRLYRTADGETWEALGAEPTSYMFALADDVLLRTHRPGGWLTMFRSADDGQTWQQCVWADNGEPFVWLTQDAWLVHWGHHQAANGTVVIVEYKAPAHAQYGYRSDDSGCTWTQVLDGGTGISHFHAVCKQEAVGRWIAVTGDGTASQTVWASDDDGLNWYHYVDTNTLWFQPTALLDYADPSRILFGSDLAWQVGTLDVSDGRHARTIRQVITNWDMRVSRGYCFLLFEQDGVHYACQMDNFGSPPRSSVISVSADLENWGVYHRFVGNESGAFEFAGLAGGKLNLTVTEGSSYFRLSPTPVATHTATIVLPPTSNMYPEATSTGSSIANWINGSEIVDGSRGLLEVAADGGQAGDACVHYFRADGGRMLLHTPAVPVQTGRTYQARFWIRGTGGFCQANWNAPPEGTVLFGVTQPEWLEVILPPYTPAGGVSTLRSFIIIYPTATGVCEAYIDSLQFEEAPGTGWHPGGEERRATTLSATVETESAWTDVFTIEPDLRCDFVSGLSSLSIRRYTNAAGGVLELSWDPAEQRFVLRSVVTGLAHEALLSTPQEFGLRAHIRFGIRCDAERISLALSNGQPIERITSINPIGASSGPLTIECGVAADKNVLPHAVFNNRFYAEYLDDAELDAAMDDVGTPPTAPTGATASVTSACEGQEVTLTAEGGSGGVHVWYRGGCGSGDYVGTGESISIAAPAGLTTYFVRVEGPGGNSACSSVTLDVMQPAVPPLGVTIGPDPVCAGEPVTLTAQGGAGDTYTWYLGGCGDSDPIGTGKSLSITAPASETRCFVRTEGACGVSDCTSAVIKIASASRWYRDADGDGHGDSTQQLDQCKKPEGYVSNSDDCDDADASTHPGADTICDGKDHDCDGQIDDESLAKRWYRDADGDGYGDPVQSLLNCTKPAGYVSNPADCDDGDPAISPDALDCADYPDGIDNDCNGQTDDNFSCRRQPGADAEPDADGDGVPDSHDACPNTAPEATVAANGCSCDQIDYDGDGVDDCADLCPGIPGSPPGGCPTGLAGLCGSAGVGLIGLSGVGMCLAQHRRRR